MNFLGVFVRHPLPGRVKTRLAAGMGAAAAARLYAAFIADLVHRFRDSADRRVLCYDPDAPETRDYFRAAAGGDYELWPQPDGPLGARLAAFFDDGFAGGAGRVVAIGSDSPTLPREFVEQSFADLQSHECVLGPAADGGYYLVGQRGHARPIFEGVEWSTAAVLSQTVARVNSCGATLAVLPPWYDVDSQDDLRMLRGHIAALRTAGKVVDLPHTEPLLGLDTAREEGVL